MTAGAAVCTGCASHSKGRLGALATPGAAELRVLFEVLHLIEHPGPEIPQLLSYTLPYHFNGVTVI